MTADGGIMASATDTPEYQLDPMNANRGTPRGEGMVNHSLGKLGAGRSIVSSADNVILAGNKTYQQARELGIPIREIESDGSVLYVIKRTDLPYDDPRAKELGFVDNRSSEIGLEWDGEMVQAIIDAGAEVEDYTFPDELELILATPPDADTWGEAFGNLPDGEKSPFQQMTFTVSDEQAEQVQAALAAAKHVGPFVDTGNENSNGNALARICETYLTEHGR